MNASTAVLLGTARPNFLVLTPISVFLGVAVAGATGGAALSYGWLVLALVGAIAAHASVNMLNEYEDFRSGLDFQTRRTPFSGGSGTLVAQPTEANWALAGGLAALAVTVITGCVLVYFCGWGLLPLGALGVLLVGGYSSHIVRSPLASLVAPGLGFGPLMVLGTAYVLVGEFTTPAILASLVPFFLVNGLLLLNQFPDVPADREFGRRNLPIAIGRRGSAIVYGVLVAGAFASVAGGIAVGAFPAAAGLALLPCLGAPYLVARVHRYAEDTDRLEPFLGWNVIMTLITPALLGFGLLAG